jgi:hypothetical protein
MRALSFPAAKIRFLVMPTLPQQRNALLSTHAIGAQFPQCYSNRTDKGPRLSLATFTHIPTFCNEPPIFSPLSFPTSSSRGQ